MAAGQEPTNAELMDAILQLHAYVESGFASVAREFVAVRHELRSEFRHELGREIGTLRHDMNRRFDRVDDRFDRVDDRFDRLERRVEGLERPA